MKKQLLKGLAIIATLFAVNASAQTRYIDQVFPGVTKTSNIMYDSNAAVNVLYGQVPGIPALFSNKLKCDVYEPTGDVQTKRPLIILAHTGSYLPALVNKQTTGNKNDSSIVQIATQLALRGYVVAAIDYRSGWNPTTTNQSAATEQLLKATYRGLQDVRNAVRFFRANANTYKIDTAKIVAGGQGTGGYITYALATVNTRADIESNIKFLRGDATPMVSMDTLGDWTGLAGWAPMNYGADAAVNSNVSMVFNWGGAMGDTAWMKANSLPIVSMQCTKDPFAPYRTGNVIVPTTGITVIPNASGAAHVIPKANKMGINNKLNAYGYEDAISKRAMMVPNSENNMFGFESSFPFENSPWEWWSSAILRATTMVPYQGSPSSAPFYGFLPTNGREADSLSLITNPNMSDVKGKAYCDTVVRFVAPRIAVQLDLTGIVALNNFAPITPANSASLDVYDSTILVNLKWQKASVAGAAAGSTIYTFELDSMGGNFKNPVVSIPAVDVDTFSLPQNAIFDLLTTLNVPANMPIPLKWRVVASNEYYSKASSVFNISLTKKVKANGIEDMNLNAFVNVFPNPAKDNIQVNMDNSKAPMNSLTICDIMGREVLVVNGMNTHNQNINTSAFVSGMYIITVKTSNGSIATKRFTIQ